MVRKLQHPIPSKFLEQIGDITVSFAMLEMNIKILIGSLIGEHQRIGQIITADLAFKSLRPLAIGLYKERHGKDADFNTLDELMKRVETAAEKRNQITHSFWAASNIADTITRVKPIARVKHGFDFHFVALSESDLVAIALELKTLAAEVLDFWLHLMDQGKAVNNPM